MRQFCRNLNRFVRAGGDKLTRSYLTSLSDTNNVAVLQTNWNSLPLNGRWFLVTNLIDDSEDLGRDRRLVPRSQRMGDRATCSGFRERWMIGSSSARTSGSDTEVLPEDTPVSVLHLVERLI